MVHCFVQYRAPRSNNTLRMLEAAGLAAITVNMMLGLSYFAGTCVDVPDWHEKARLNLLMSRFAHHMHCRVPFYGHSSVLG